jgi:hypothetical protein
MGEEKKMRGTKEGRMEKVEAFENAVKAEQISHPKSRKVLFILCGLVILCMIRQFVSGNYEGFALCILTLLLLILPSTIEVGLNVVVPQRFEIAMLVSIYAAEVLGEINKFYVIIPYWDTILHTFNGFLAAGVGYSLVTLLNKNEKLTFALSPAFTALVAFCFSMTIGIFWEFFEFGMDCLFNLDMQKDTVIHTIGSITLDPAHGNTPYLITGITGTAVNGKNLGIDGYLDIGLIDTMEDLFVNFIGALVFSVIGYRYSKSQGKDNAVIKDFIVARPSGFQEKSSS